MVMSAAAYLPAPKLGAWLKELSGRSLVLSPQARGDAVIFAPFAEGVDPVLDRDATTPPKQAVFPATEELLRYRRVKDPTDPGRVDVEVSASVSAVETVVFGARPCGARGFLACDRVFRSPAVSDPCYVARRAKTLFVTVACAAPGNSCFCHWVGSGPADASGSDLLLTPVADGFVVQAVSERGEELMDSPLLEPAGEREEEAREVQVAAAKALPAAPDISRAKDSLMAVFGDMGFWEEVSAKCISCGACTYLCPTCHCFDISDEDRGMSGRRLRTWDNCMSFQFTLEASGHNPRPSKAHRLRNRVGHKFSYYPALHGGAVACCGCGRCVRLCPASVDIREIVLAAIARAARVREESAHD